MEADEGRGAAGNYALGVCEGNHPASREQPKEQNQTPGHLRDRISSVFRE